MAHMGATIELPKQPAKQAGFGPVIPAAALIVVIGLVVAMGAWLIGTNVASGSRATDGSYDQIESLRGAAALSLAADRSTDKVESLKGGAFLPLDNSYDLIEALKSGAFLPHVDTGLDTAVRGGWFVTPSATRMTPLSGDGVVTGQQETRGLHGALP
jgi:hypothetical protein